MDLSEVKQRLYQDEFKVYLEELLDQNLIEDERAKGIANFIMDNGLKQLTDKQWYVFLKHGVGEINYVEECERCAMEIPWVEMLGAVYIYEDDLCGYCRHKIEKGE